VVFLYILIALLGGALLWIIADVVVALRQRPIPDLPKEFLSSAGLSLVYYYLTEPDKIPEGVTVDEEFILNSLEPSIKYINARYDCADFRCQLLFRLYKDCSQQLSEKVKSLITKTFLDFKYNMDEPGEDSMCFWSENHQILFAVSEYLAGQEWPDKIFTNSGMTGAQHMEKALKIINHWMEQKYYFGFFEWYSNNYYAENIAPMSNYIEYSQDAESVNRMKIIFDLLWFDVASHSVNNTFVAVSSRMYGDNKSSNVYGNRIRGAMAAIWGKTDTQSLVHARSEIERMIMEGSEDVATTIKLVGIDSQMIQNFTAMYKKGFYKVPEVIYNTALDKEPAIIKASSGLNVSELKELRLIGQDYHQIMAQMGSESFSNHEVIENTLKFLNRTKMFRNIFVNPFRFINIKLLRLLGIPRLISKKLPLMTNGIALQRGNVYCYRTADYCLTTAIKQGVDMCGAQGHIWTANIAPDLAVYTTHPARDDDSREKHAASPGYWVGNGRQPMSVQHKNINITIYKIPRKKRLAEFHLADITHAYMPKEKFDEFHIEDNLVFGRKGRVLLAMIASGKLTYREYDAYAAALLCQHDQQVEKIDELKDSGEFDLVLKGGEYHSYITELSDIDAESFEQFQKRIRSNIVSINQGEVVYKTRNTEMTVSYDGVFEVDGKPQPTEYKRFDSRYSVTERQAEIIYFNYGGKKWMLDYKNNIRKEVE
jgi:hypothetical protein